jgi:hypothetical protein
MRTMKGAVRTVSKSLMRSRWAAFGAAIAVTFGGGAVWVANAAVVSSDTFTSITPCRLLDTRNDGDQGATNKGIRKGFVGAAAQAGTVNNDITVIFDSRAVRSGGDFTLKYNDTGSDLRPIMGDCDAAFSTGDLMSATVVKALLLNVTTIGSNGVTSTSSSGLARNFTDNGFVTVYPWLCWPTTTTGCGASARPVFSVLNPVAGLSTVHNNVTVQLAPITTALTMPNVACSDGTGWGNSNCQYDGDGTANVNRLNAFRLYNQNGNIHVVIDVLGYYS